MKRSLVALALIGILAGCGSSSSKSSSTSTTPTTAQDVTADKTDAQAASLKLTDLPSGWTASPQDNSTDSSTAALDTSLATCLGVSVSDLNHKGPADFDSPKFDDANNNSISNSLGYEASAGDVDRIFGEFSSDKVPGCLSTAITDYIKAQSTQSTDTLPPGVTFGSATIKPITFATVGDKSTGYQVTMPVSGGGVNLAVYLDLYVAVRGRANIEMDFSSVSQPFPQADELKYLNLVVGRLTRT